MAMTISTEGLTEVSEMLAKLGDRAQEVASGALFDGAGVVADAYRRAVESIRTEPFRGKRDHRLPSPEEKNALIGKTGIAKFSRDGGEVNTVIGISGSAGYADIAGNKRAVRLIARSINSGTSFMQKQPVFRKAVNDSRTAAERAIASRAEKEFEKIIKG